MVVRSLPLIPVPIHSAFSAGSELRKQHFPLKVGMSFCFSLFFFPRCSLVGSSELVRRRGIVLGRTELASRRGLGSPISDASDLDSSPSCYS